jgi:hypothetical protein
MSRSRLERMRANPAGDWTIEDVEAACRERGFRCRPPKGGGSHYKVSHPARGAIYMIPRRRPIKRAYIRDLVRFIDAIEAEIRND